MLADIAPILILILALALPVFIILVSFRLNFILHASILLIVFLLGSVMAGASGLINIYRHLANILQLDRVTALLSFLTQSQTITRTLLSTVTTAIFIVKFFTKINASKETVNNAGIGFFILMLVTKFCCATYKPGLCEVLRRRGGRQQPGRGRTEPTVLISGWLRLGSVCLLEQSRRNCSRKALRSCSCGELGFSSRLELVDTEAAARLWVSPR